MTKCREPGTGVIYTYERIEMNSARSSLLTRLETWEDSLKKALKSILYYTCFIKDEYKCIS